VSGDVTEVNAALAERPETVNSDPHGAWMIKLRISDASGLHELLDAGQYTELTK
jgi:glycine cleavage system H protein